MKKIGLSKSKITMWRQCPKRLWLYQYKPELQEVSQTTTTKMEIGHQVGEIAQSLFAGGFLVDDDNLTSAISTTKSLLAKGDNTPIFEATLEHDGLLVRADLLVPSDSGYRLVEVKSSGGLKDYYHDDFTVQKWVFDRNEVSVSKVELAHIDTSFTYAGDGDYSKLLKFLDVEKIVEANIENVQGWINGARDTLIGPEPAISYGKQCHEPFDCPFIDYCNPPNDSTSQTPGLNMYYRLNGKTKEELETKGIINGLDVPDEYLSDVNRRIKSVTQKGTYHLDAEAKVKIECLPFPRYYFDFETINFTVPIWAGTRPFQQIPFQWSCHVEYADGPIEHFEFLDISGLDPRRACAEKILRIMGNSGPIIVYNQSFEKNVISGLASLFPDLSKPLLELNDRVFDLLPIMRSYYYHPDMLGSWSIKAVLPTIAPELSYDNLEVGNGGDAQEAYLEIINPNTEGETRQNLKSALLEYCEQDTLAMVRIVEFISESEN